MTTTYARITTVDHQGTRETLNVEIMQEAGDGWMIARKVDATGTWSECRYEKDPNGCDVLVEVTRLIAVDTIVKRVPLAVSKHYGTLEPA